MADQPIEMVDSLAELDIRPSHVSAVLRRWAFNNGLAAPRGPVDFGPSGKRWHGQAAAGAEWSVIVTQGEHDGVEWIHASIARLVMPTYDDLKMLHHAVFGLEREAYQVFPPSERHVSIHDRALHLWGRADGAGVLPPFGEDGSI